MQYSSSKRTVSHASANHCQLQKLFGERSGESCKVKARICGLGVNCDVVVLWLLVFLSDIMTTSKDTNTNKGIKGTFCNIVTQIIKDTFGQNGIFLQDANGTLFR